MDMLPNNLFLTLLLGFGILSLVLALIVDLTLVHLKKISYRKFPLWLSGLVAILGAIGVGLIFAETRSYEALRQSMAWPSVQGEVMGVKVAGSRAFIPYLSYRYTIGEKSYTTTAELYVPQYGTKQTRKHSAEDVAARYKPGEGVTVYYNPKNPGVSQIEFGRLSWDLFIRLGVGIMLYSAAIVVAVDRGIRWAFGSKLKNL